LFESFAHTKGLDHSNDSLQTQTIKRSSIGLLIWKGQLSLFAVISSELRAVALLQLGLLVQV